MTNHNTDMLVFLPVRNGGEYLRECVASILAQRHHRLTLIVLDNNSSDGSIRELRKLSDSRIIIESSTKDLSIEVNWRRIYEWIETSKPSDDQLLTIVCHDDILYPSFVGEVVSVASKHPRVNIFQSHFDLIDDEGNIIRKCLPIPQFETQRDYFIARSLGFRDSYATGYSFRAGRYRKIGGIPSLPLLLYADDLLVIRAIGEETKICIPQILCAYRSHSQSTSGTRSKAMRETYSRAFLEYMGHLESDNQLDLRRDTYVRSALQALLNGQFPLVGRGLGANTPQMATFRQRLAREYGIDGTDNYPVLLGEGLRSKQLVRLRTLANLVMRR